MPTYTYAFPLRSGVEKQRLFKCAVTGLENEDSGLGCYAMDPADYDVFAAYFDKVHVSTAVFYFKR